MRTFSFYEQCGILIPGAVFLFVLVAAEPEILSVFSKEGMSLGGLGLFIILAYACGHAVAAVGNAVESIFWKPFGGMPSDWPTRTDARLLTEAQRDRVAKLAADRFGISIGSPAGMTKREWRGVFGQIYRDVLGKNRDRVEVFNGNYGLNRGLAAAFLCASGFFIIRGPSHAWGLAGASLALSTVYLFRMYRFGVHFAREVFLCFINPLPSEVPGQP